MKQKVEDIRGRTILPDGTVIKMQEEHIFEKQMLKYKGEEYEGCSFSIPGVTSDCIIEYMIKLRTHYPEGEWIIQKEVPLLSSELLWKFHVVSSTRFGVLEVYGQSSPNYLWLNPPEEKDVEYLPSLKETEELRFTTGFVTSFEDEPLAPPDPALQTRLLLYYGSEASPEAFWGNIAMRISVAMQEFASDNDKLADVIDSLSLLENDEEKIAGAFNWVRENIKNVTYEKLLDKKGREKEPDENEEIDDVIKRGYGTEEDINLVFWDMLRELNIDAKISYVKDRTDDLLVSSAKYWQFDNSLVALPNEDNSCVFYSPGHWINPMHIVPWYCEGVSALLAGADVIFQPVPASESRVSKTTLQHHYFVDRNLEISGVAERRSIGHEASTLRSLLVMEDSVSHEDILHDFLLEHYLDAELDSLEWSLDKPQNDTAILSYRLEFPRIGRQGDRIMLKPLAFAHQEENQLTAPKRDYNILFPYAYQTSELVVFNLPDEWHVEAVPSDTMFNTQAGRCGIQFTVFGSQLSVQEIFELSYPFWRADQYDMVKQLCDFRDRIRSSIVLLSRTEAATAERDD
jgi:hypothetical protein